VTVRDPLALWKTVARSRESISLGFVDYEFDRLMSDGGDDHPEQVAMPVLYHNQQVMHTSRES